MKKRRVRRHSVVQPFDQSIRLIPLTQGQNAVVDAQDYEWLNQWNWIAQLDKATGKFYALRRVWNCDRSACTAILMAKLIMGVGCSKETQVDHRDLDTLNNRRTNLRVATHSQNQCNRPRMRNNTSGFKGVRKYYRKWHATAGHNGKTFYLGSFASREDAARAYDAFVKEKHGEFARTNF